MNDNNWYSAQNTNYRQVYPSPDPSTGRVAADSVQDAHRLLGVYPFASATPTTHVARHLSNLSIGPVNSTFTYTQPHYPIPGNAPYVEYAQEINYLSSARPSGRDGGYWDMVRNDAVRFLSDQSTSAYSYGQHAVQPAWQSSYQPNHFAQSVFRQTVAPGPYPTPSPGISPPGISTSSSSLAFALQELPPTKPPRTVYEPQASSAFFDDFLARKTREMESMSPVTPNLAKVHPMSSPDPLAVITPPKVITPSKRMSVDYLESPSVKRVHYANSLKRPSPARKESTLDTTPVSHTKAIVESRKKRPQPYVDVPPLPKGWSTPISSKKSGQTLGAGSSKMDVDGSDDDLGGYGSEEDVIRPRSSSVTSISDGIKSSAKRTGERDDRAPVEKFIALVESIFATEDDLPPHAGMVDLPLDFFSTSTVDFSRPLLNPSVIRKISTLVGKIARPTKRLRFATRDGGGRVVSTPKGKGRMSDVDPSLLSRTLKILERSVKAGEDLDPFRSNIVKSDMKTPRKSTSAKKSWKTPKKRGKPDAANEVSQDEKETIDEMNVDENVDVEHEPDEADLISLTKVFEIAKESVSAADCCIALLVSDRLTKQLYSEELITSCLSTVKNQLAKIVYPFVEASTDPYGNASPLLRYLTRSTSADVEGHRRLLAEIFQALSSAIPHINALVCADTISMSDAITIQAVYISIGPFFVVDSSEAEGKGKKVNVVLNTLGSSAMRGLRLEALALIRSIFANNEDQRSWIIEEILSSLIKLSDAKQKAGQFRLRDGRSIRTVSALLLQLVQTSAHDVRTAVRKIQKRRQQTLARKDSWVDASEKRTFLDDNDLDEVGLYSSGLESAMKAAKTIVAFLTQRSGKGKATKNSNEAEYRTIFDNLISDLLVVLFWPEWPASSLLLGIICKYMVSSLDDIKTIQNDSNAAKTVALDHLGVIAARLRSSTLKFRPNSAIEGQDGGGFLRPLEEILSHTDGVELERLVSVQYSIATHLCKRSSEDQAYDSARELTAALWGHELALVLKQCDTLLSSDEPSDKKVKQVTAFGEKVKESLYDVWKDPGSDVFDIGSEEEAARIDKLAEEVGTIQSMKNSFNPILTVILSALDAPPVFMRTKALRALGQIVTSDPSILSAPNVRHAIESHLLDSSPAVRDAAVDLIGKYMIDSPTVTGDYYPRIAERIADTGLGVRKRVIKLLKSFYNVTDDLDRRVDICTKLVMRMLDEDTTVKDLAVKTLEELWFQDIPSSGQKPRSSTNNTHDKLQLLSKVTVIMAVSGNFKDRQSPLEDILHRIMVDKDDNDASQLRSRYVEICDTLIDGLVDASDLPGFTVINCVRTIHLFTSAYPQILSTSKASTLLPYLKNSSSPEEQMTSDYLSKIFRVSIPHMPKTAAAFGQELQLALQPMILKPTASAGVLGLQETVACICTVVQHLTHDFSRLVNLLKSCNQRLQTYLGKPDSQALTGLETRTLSILMFIVSLLCENCDFDRLSDEREDIHVELDSITSSSITRHVYDTLLKLYGKYSDPASRGRVLQCLGFLFRAQPTLMTLESSATIMDNIFTSSQDELRGRLLKIIQDFLLSEASKHNAKEKEKIAVKSTAKVDDKINMAEFVGNTDGFADSGVSSAVVQRYLSPILEAALAQQPQVQAAAVDILTFTIRQGLAHPLQSFPVIVALETSPNATLSTRANVLHGIVHNKHASLLNSRYIISAKSSFDYQKRICAGPVQGYRILQQAPVALLHRWYSLVREKRVPRQEFLKALVKVFDVDTSMKSQDYIDFARYMAENFASFDYKTQEEVLTVAKSLTSVLSTTGMQVVESISPSHLLSQLRDDSHAMETELQANDAAKVQMLRCSVVIGMVMLLKAHLKSQYGLSEEKCAKWLIGKKTAIGDKAVTRRNEQAISWERLPFATRPIVTSQDMAEQRAVFLTIWSEDGLREEPED